MQSAFHTTATVMPGRRIELSVPDLREGDKVQVVVIPVPAANPETRTGLEIIEAYQGLPAFGSAEAIDQFINEERDSWDR